MTRSGYSDDCDGWGMIRCRGAVASAIRGKRGQAFLRDMRDALEAMPEKRLARSVLVSDTGCCAMGAVAIRRGLDVSAVDPYEREAVAKIMGIAPALAAEIAFVNDGDWRFGDETPEKRWELVHEWVCRQTACAAS